LSENDLIANLVTPIELWLRRSVRGSVILLSTKWTIE